MSRIYTRTGDSGETGLFGGGRVAKSHSRVVAYGEVDELNAVVGWAITRVQDSTTADRLAMVQDDLFALGAQLATPPDARSRRHLPELPRSRTGEFEAWIDEVDAELGPLSSFILPGGSEGSSALHMARTVCRRAERAVVALAREEEVDSYVVVYLNRLSDLLFELARMANRQAGIDDTPWRPES
jgi:cob(I)alamin adenosyltransferase